MDARAKRALNRIGIVRACFDPDGGISGLLYDHSTFYLPNPDSPSQLGHIGRTNFLSYDEFSEGVELYRALADILTTAERRRLERLSRSKLPVWVGGSLVRR